ncbi:glutaminase A [Antrihabitans cavernicola]|uniref:Glutaminase n=1 Tax=Antrihabitans cavernicola TaxID=2495913 RepID=A0A5A7SFZ2_9NOCA|nr:glutaminase A [Spelaeibacter cavernicola]KAA0023415.1 glutaminase A [Spelaeibacter cavernicola]
MPNVVDGFIAAVYDECLRNRDGALADYIPELDAVEPDSFGICIATSDGYVYEVGDTDVPFTIQSISKPFTYGLALGDRGLAGVAEKIDVEPSGEPFNEISLDPVTERPRNPMINAGAITSASLITGASASDRFERIRATYSRYAGRELAINDSVYRSEARTGHRNRAIGHMLRSFDIITDDPDQAVDTYFQQCSIDVTCRDLSMMAATMANNGVNPTTHERALSTELVERVLSVMTTCGMYDAAGTWVADVGLPAKSGVGGGVLAVLPGQIGIAVYSPRLDEHGNSVRGVQACRMLSRELELHFLHVPRPAKSSIRARYTVADAPSRTRRTDAERATLQRNGSQGRIFELHGDLLFAGAETAVREISLLRDKVDALIIDVRRVDDVGLVARRMLDDLRHDLLTRGCQVVLVDPEGLLGGAGVGSDAAKGRTFADLESATEWVEEILLDRHCGGRRQPTSVPIGDHPMLARLTPKQLSNFLPELAERTYVRDEVLMRHGDTPDGLFLITSGRVSTTVTAPDEVTHRITTLAAGMSFGEMPMLLGTDSLVDVRADSRVTVYVLPAAAFAALTTAYPDVKLALLEQLAAGAYQQMSAAIQTLSQRISS